MVIGQQLAVPVQRTEDADGAHFMLLTDTVNAIFRVEDNLLRVGVLGVDTNVRVLVSLLPASR